MTSVQNAAAGREEFRYEIVDRVAYMTIDRPERANSINQAVRRGLIEAFADASTNPDVWLVVLRGTGEKVFCAGGDLKEKDELTRGIKRYTAPMTGPERNLYETVLETYKPTIAVVNGAAYGGGMELALACDMRIAATGARFALPEAKRSMGANFASVVLPRLIPRAIAMQMLYTGEPITAEEAQHWGLINAVVPSEALDATVSALVAQILQNAPLSLMRYKHMAVKGWELPIASALRLDAGPNPYTSNDREEGVRAFVEKRQARWTGT